MCRVGTFCPKNIPDVYVAPSDVIQHHLRHAGSSNTSSFVAPKAESARYHARFDGANTVNGPGLASKPSKPVA